MSGTSDLAAKIASELDAHFGYTGLDRHMLNGLALAEEAGEAVGALRRYLGLARRSGSLEDVAAELADVTLTVYLVAHYLGIDMDPAIADKAEVIFARGFRDR